VPTYTFNWDDATNGVTNVRYSGRWGLGTLNGTSALVGLGGSSAADRYLEFTLDLSDAADVTLNVSGANSASSLTVSVDGAAAATVPTTADLNFYDVAIATGLAAGTRTFKVTTNALRRGAACLKVTTDGTVTLRRTTGQAGRQYTVRDTSATVHDGNGAAGNHTAAFRNEARVTTQSGLGYETYRMNSPDDTFGFRTLAGGSAATTVRAYGFRAAGAVLDLRMDNAADVGSVTVSGSGWGWVEFPATVDCTAARRFDVRARNSTAFQVWQVQLDGASLDTSAFARRATAHLFGDSIVAGYNALGAPSSRTLATSIARYVQNTVDWACANLGISGTTLHNYTGEGTAAANYTTSSGRARLAAAIQTQASANAAGSVPYAPAVFFNMTGTNDANNAAGVSGSNILQPTGAVSHQTDVQAHAEAVLGTTGWGSVKYVEVGIIPRSDMSDGTRAAWNAAKVAGLAAMSSGNRARAFYLDPAQFGLALNATDYGAEAATSGNFLHPAEPGQEKMAWGLGAFMLAVAGTAPYAISLSASSGVAGQPVTATLTLASGLRWTGAQTVTLAWGDGTTATVTPAYDATTATADKTYAAAGSYTVSESANGQGWTTAPASAAYAATSANAAPSAPTLTAGTPAQTSVTLTSSAFSDTDVGDTHAASQWQVTATVDTGFASPVVSTGDDGTNKTSYAATGLTASTAYRARVRHKDSAGNYSAWSTAATFTTAAPPTPVVTASAVPTTVSVSSGEVTLSAAIENGGGMILNGWICTASPVGASVDFTDSATTPTIAYGLTVPGDYTFEVTYADEDDLENEALWVADTVTVTAVAGGVVRAPLTRLLALDIL
jgi:hypothetical protein